MDVLLDLEQVHQRFVDDAVGLVPALVEQTAERILHRTGDGGEDVRLDRRELNDVAVVKELGNLDALREDAVQHQKRLARVYVTHSMCGS